MIRQPQSSTMFCKKRRTAMTPTTVSARWRPCGETGPKAKSSSRLPSPSNLAAAETHNTLGNVYLRTR